MIDDFEDARLSSVGKDTASSDEEYRRWLALGYIKTYIDTYLSNENVIVLGDYNDELTRGKPIIEIQIDVPSIKINIF
ncbi:hypothetical protein N9Y89_02385 [bacterium]|nr:hypothetical protein [bacterium]